MEHCVGGQLRRSRGRLAAVSHCIRPNSAAAALPSADAPGSTAASPEGMRMSSSSSADPALALMLTDWPAVGSVLPSVSVAPLR